MDKLTLNKIIESITFKHENISELINALPEDQRVNALSVLLGTSTKLTNLQVRPKGHDLSDDVIYLKPLFPKHYNPLTKEVTYVTRLAKIKYKYYKSEEDMNKNISFIYTREEGYDFSKECSREQYDHTDTCSLSDWNNFKNV